MRTANPALNGNTFLDVASGRMAGGATMTLNGTVNKSAMLVALLLITAVYSWSRYTGPDSIGGLMPLLWIGIGGGAISALVTIFKKTWAPITAPIYALFEGLFLGAVSAVFEARFPGIVMQAVMLTIGTLVALLAAYRSGLIKVTENFKLGVVAATGAIALLYLVNFVAAMFGHPLGIVHSNSLLSIGLSVVIVIVAALNLVLDFDFIESGVDAGAPKYMEWYAAFGLLVTLVWLYIEILRLLSKLQSRN